MSYNSVQPGDDRSDGPAYGHESSTGELAIAGSPYLEFINRSFSTDQDLSLPDRVISSPVLDHPNLPNASSSTLSPSPRERILNNLFKRGSKETLSKETLQRSSPIITPQQQQASPSLASARRVHNSSSSSGASSSTLSSPAIPKSILKQSRTPTSMHSSLPSLPSATPQPTAPLQHQLQQQQPRLQTSSQQYQPAAYLPPASSSLQPPFPAAPMTHVDYPPPPPSSAYNNSHNNNNANSFSIEGLVRPASPFAMRPSSQGSGDAGTYTNNTNSLSSTHRSSHNFGSGTDTNYNVTQTDLTLDSLAQRWQAYQAVMRKRYYEEPFYKRWTKSKWMLLLSATILLAYSCAVLVVAVGYLTHRVEHAVIMMEFHSNLIILALVGSIVAIASAAVGFLGIFRENRSLLTIYTTMLWAVFALYVAVGYIAFRRERNHLNQSLRNEWIHDYTRDQRLLVQRQFKCCGFLSPNSNGEYDMRCFPLINLPGCQFKYREYERQVLSTSWTTSFSIVPFQLFVMIVALLCSNHVDGMLRSARPGLKSFKEVKQE